ERSGLSRRKALGLGAAAVGAAAVGSVVSTTAAADATPPAYPPAPTGSTLLAPMLHGTPGAKGYRKVVAGPGEPSPPAHQVVGTPAAYGTRTPLLAFVQLTDMHIIDAQSPLRVEYLDRLNDPGQPTASVAPFSSSYRPHEMLTAHIAESMVQAVNKLGGGTT